MLRFKRFIGIVFGVLFTLTVIACGCFFALLFRAPVFCGGENYTLYQRASSSAPALAASDPVLDKLCSGEVAGESVQYDGDCYLALKERFHAELLFTEEACGVVNYYLYSPLLRGGMRLFGHTVNLHIAVGEEKTAAGTPVIFGGF